MFIIQGSLTKAKEEVTQARSISASLLESEKKIGKLNWTIENLNTEIEEWKQKHNEISASYDDVTIEKKGIHHSFIRKVYCQL